jgi:uncharacterized membrane protein YuzA (DUF378 family)
MSTLRDRFEGVWTPMYLQKFLFKIAMVLLIAGGLNWLSIALFDCNLVCTVFGDGVISKLIYILVGLSALGVMLDRDTYLPFLGPMVAPCTVLENREPPGATKEIKVIVPANSKVIYWAAEPGAENMKQLKSWKDAYVKYENAGVATANADGIAILKVRPPQSYKVPFKGKIESHVHYRVCGDAGWMGSIQTAFVNHDGPEGFECQPYRVTNLADSAASIF